MSHERSPRQTAFGSRAFRALGCNRKNLRNGNCNRIPVFARVYTYLRRKRLKQKIFCQTQLMQTALNIEPQRRSLFAVFIRVHSRPFAVQHRSPVCRKAFIILCLAAAALTSWGALPKPPEDWRIELVASAPEVQHPSVVCVAPDGRVFVAEDPMDISTAHADAKEGRIICLRPDGRRTVFAEQLHAVFGMQFLEGKLYVLHNPHFSVFTDDNGMGKDRTELIESMNPNPWALDWNDHVPANFRLAMDGYFYVAVGDKGIFGAVGRDGKRVDMRGGGVLRLRPDGTELEVYCTGVRNILEVALNDEDEIFTYDNTDEHDWMGRLTHMVDGVSYGYPYDFVPRRPYTLWMMHDFGGGAATGALCYNEDALPDEYHGNLFLGDFGKQQILRVRIARSGGTYRVVAHEEFFRNPP